MTGSSVPARYAAAYQAHADAWSGVEWGPFVLGLLDHRPAVNDSKPPADRPRWCDLCCGTGQLLRFAEAEGFDATGVDHCPAMLDYAKSNAPGARLVCADATGYQPTRQFDVITCLAHSINHLTAAQDVRRLLASAAPMLKPGGRFIFDLLTPIGMRQSLGARQICHAPSRCTVIRIRRAAQPDCIEWVLTSFTRTGHETFDRFDHALTLRGYAPEPIDRWLGQCGLTATRYDAESLDAADAHSPRMLYCCGKG